MGRRAKKFEPGQAVEIQREPGAAWEPATYRDRALGMVGWHHARVPEDAEPRYVDSMTGLTYTRDDIDARPPTDGVRQRVFATPIMLVPSQRIRATSRTGK